MDDYSLSSLSESKNEWCSRLVNTLTPAIIDGLRSIYNESLQLCIENDEEDKYLMTFQTFLSRIPQWNAAIIKAERERIETTTNCGYLEELITCVHVIQLKALTCVRVGAKQKKVDIDIPSSDGFIHKVYVNSARKVYTNIYLFEKDIPPLDIQKNSRELEIIIKESILNSIRDTMPIDKILVAYMDETEEEDIVVEEKIIHEEIPEGVKTAEPTKTPEVAKTPEVVKAPEVVKPPTSDYVKTPEPIKTPQITTLATIDPPPSLPAVKSSDSISFSDTDSALDSTGTEIMVPAPKDIQHLEDLRRRREEEEEEEEDDDDKLKIGGNIDLEISDVNDLSKTLKLESLPVLDDIEILEPL